MKRYVLLQILVLKSKKLQEVQHLPIVGFPAALKGFRQMQTLACGVTQEVNIEKSHNLKIRRVGEGSC